MKTLELLLIGGAALLFLSKKSEATGAGESGAYSPTAPYSPVASSIGVFEPGTKPQAVAQKAEEVIAAGLPSQAGIASFTPSTTPKTAAEQIGNIARALATGADAQAAVQEAKLMAMGTPKTAEVVASEIQQGLINTSTGGLNAVWTGVGFYNPFTGITHVPTMYK
jgi:hypothetical protein